MVWHMLRRDWPRLLAEVLQLDLLWVEVPMDQIEEEGDESEEVDEDEADEDSLRDPDEIVHGASLKC